MKQSAIAAFGELLFYSATQAETHSTEKKHVISDPLKFGYPILMKLLKICNYRISLTSVSKTIENITKRTKYNGEMFVNEENVIALIDVFERQNNSYSKETCFRALESIFQRKESMTMYLKNRKTFEICYL